MMMCPMFRSTPLEMMMTMIVTWKMLLGLKFHLLKVLFLKVLLVNMPVVMLLSPNLLMGLASADAHVSQPVLHAMRRCGRKYAVIPGGLTMFIQSIHTALAALYCVAHHTSYVSHIEHEGQLTVAQRCNVFLELCYVGPTAAFTNLDVTADFMNLSYIDPTQVKF